MSVMGLYIAILIAFTAGAIAIAIILKSNFKKAKRIELVQGKLANSDSYIADVVPFLKVTNEWSSINDVK